MEVSILVDVVMVFGVLVVLPLVVGVGITTWIVSVGPSSVQVYMHSMSIITAGNCTHHMLLHVYVHSADHTCVDHFHCWLSTNVGSTDCPHLHSVELA